METCFIGLAQASFFNMEKCEKAQFSFIVYKHHELVHNVYDNILYI